MNRFRFRLFSPHFALCAGLLVTPHVFSQDAKYEIRAQTGDRARSAVGGARQGSFGAPSINNKGNLAYACILSGPNIGAQTSYSVVFSSKGKNKQGIVAVQSGIPRSESVDPRALGNDFLVNPEGGVGISDSAEMFRISREVAINEKNNIAFSGQMIELVARPLIGIRSESFSAIGVSIPSGNIFTQASIVTFNNYNPEVLERTTSTNNVATVPFNAEFVITTTESLPGFGIGSPVFPPRAVANTASPVIGLPYVTTFANFTDAIIAKNNICFVVANLSGTGAEFDGIWQGNNPGLNPVVILQTPAPGGGTFSSFDGKVGPSPSGKFAAFTADVNGGPVSRGVFRTNIKGTDIVRVADGSGNAPGTNGNFGAIEVACATDRGQVAILATVSGGSDSGRDGIWLSDPKGENLRLVAIEGQEITVGNTEKTVTRIAFSPVSGVNRKGEVAFTASFPDRTSAVIVAKF